MEMKRKTTDQDVKEVRAFQCQHCRRLFLSLQGAAHHARRCYHSEKRRACATCICSGACPKQNMIGNTADCELYLYHLKVDPDKRWRVYVGMEMARQYWPTVPLLEFRPRGSNDG